MRLRKSILFVIPVITLIITGAFVNPKITPQDFSETTKIALREVGHQLLLTQQDSISLILPVVEEDQHRYTLSFESELTFNPNHLVTITEKALKKASLPDVYRVLVHQCDDGEVAYSYEMTTEEATTLIPCGGRLLPKKCYTITVFFIAKARSSTTKVFYIIFGAISMLLVGFWLYFKKDKTTKVVGKEEDLNFTSIGSFKFYPDEHTLIKEAEAIPLSKKECELLTLFIAQPNQVITREELTKKIWEDNGVIVGRSLDTYISKLRKKLKADERIKISNVHGVGYKLEILDINQA